MVYFKIQGHKQMEYAPCILENAGVSECYTGVKQFLTNAARNI